MDEVKKVKIFEKFIEKLSKYDWETSNGTSFNYETDNLKFNFSNYTLNIDYKSDDKKKSKQSGFSFNTGTNKSLNRLYMDLCENSLEDALETIMDADPSIRRELGLDNLLE